jgi:hypothetical protein
MDTRNKPCRDVEQRRKSGIENAIYSPESSFERGSKPSCGWPEHTISEMMILLLAAK